MRRAVIFANGEMAGAADVQPGEPVICCDGGLKHIRRLGLTPNVIIGDLDSASPEDLAFFGGIETERHPVDKHKTDLELCIDYAAAHGIAHVVIYGAFGGRIDHQLACVHTLLYALRRGVLAELRGDGARVWAVDARIQIDGKPGDIVSLLPLTTAATGVTTDGLKYPLHGGALEAGTARGVSNEMTGHAARVTLGGGALAAFWIEAR